MRKKGPERGKNYFYIKALGIIIGVASFGGGWMVFSVLRSRDIVFQAQADLWTEALKEFMITPQQIFGRWGNS